MEQLKSGLILTEGEKLVVELEAELWATSSNILARAFGWLHELLNLILGIRQRGYLVITDRRVVEIRETKACWCFNASKEIKYVLPNSVKEVGYTKSGTFLGCCCQAYHFYYEAWTQKTEILLKGVDEQGAKNILNAFYAAIRSPQNA